MLSQGTASLRHDRDERSQQRRVGRMGIAPGIGAESRRETSEWHLGGRSQHGGIGGALRERQQRFRQPGARRDASGSAGTALRAHEFRHDICKVGIIDFNQWVLLARHRYGVGNRCGERVR